MKADTYQKTAQIIPFSSRIRDKNGKIVDSSRFATHEISTSVCAEALDGNWYHAEAIRDAKPPLNS